MVKSYTRLELEATFGIVSSSSSIAHIDVPRSPGLVITGADEAVHIWDLKSSELIARLVDLQQDPKAQVVHIAYEKQSEIIAAGYTDGSIRVWDVRSRSVMVVFQGHKSAISALEFSLDGTQLISGSADTTIILWDLINEQGLYRLKGHKAMITGMALINEQIMVTTAKDGIMKVWDLATQFATESKVAHKGECWGIVVMDRARLATVSNGTEIKIWQYDARADDGQQLRSLGELEKQTKQRGVKLLYYRHTLFCGSGDALQVWKQRSPEDLKRALKRKQRRAEKKNEGESSEVELRAADEFISQSIMRTKAKISGAALGRKGEVVLNLRSNSIESWSFDGDRLNVIDRPGQRTDVRDAAISSDGRLIATGSNGSIKVYNRKSRGVVRTLTDCGYILSLLFMPGDGLLVASTKEGTIDVYDITSASQIASMEAHSGSSVWSLDLSSDGTQLVSGGADKCVKFWSFKVTNDTMVLKNTHKLEFNDDVLAVKISPDMRFVAASLLDSTVKVYFRDTLKFYLNLYGHQLPVLSIDISHDSKLLVTSSADKNVKIWGLDFGDLHRSIFAHDDSVLRVKFIPGSHNFVSSSKDSYVKCWDGTKFVQIQRLLGHHSEVWALDVSSDGEFIVTASHDKTVRIWEMSDEPLFIEEEREAETEQQYEENLVESLNRDETFAQDEEGEEDDNSSSADVVKKHTIDSLKASERLYEALDICTADLEEHPNPRNVILAALDISPERYLMDVLSRIRAPIVEDALLTFPLDRITKLLKFVLIWLKSKYNLTLVCRVLFFCIRNFQRQLVANKMLLPELEQIRDHLRSNLLELADTIGSNLAEMRWLQGMWDDTHVRKFNDTEAEANEQNLKKRVYGSMQV